MKSAKIGNAIYLHARYRLQKLELVAAYRKRVSSKIFLSRVVPVDKKPKLVGIATDGKIGAKSQQLKVRLVKQIIDQVSIMKIFSINFQIICWTPIIH